MPANQENSIDSSRKNNIDLDIGLAVNKLNSYFGVKNEWIKD